MVWRNSYGDNFNAENIRLSSAPCRCFTVGLIGKNYGLLPRQGGDGGIAEMGGRSMCSGLGWYRPPTVVTRREGVLTFTERWESVNFLNNMINPFL